MIVVEQRIPRTALAIVAGVAGALMQGLTPNPLADPGLLGVSDGASFAMTVAVVFLPITSLFGYIWFSFLGAVLATLAVYALGSGRRGASPLTLTLAGVSIGAVLSGLTTTLSILNAQTFMTLRAWEAGSLADRGWDIVPVTGFVLLGLGLSFAAAPRIERCRVG